MPKENEPVTMTDEEEKLLVHLKALQEMRVALSEDLEQQLTHLEKKKQAEKVTKGLTHGHVNRVDKAKSKAEAALKKIKVLDHEWSALLKQLSSKFQEHALLYQQSRQELMEQYNLRLKELAEVKESAAQASQSLLGQQEEADLIPVVDLEQQMNAFRNELAKSAEVYDLTGDDVEEVDSEMPMEEIKEDESTAEASGERKTTRKPAFQGASSPLRVANQHLKPKKGTQQ